MEASENDILGDLDTLEERSVFKLLDETSISKLPDGLLCAICTEPSTDWRQGCTQGQHSFCNSCLTLHVNKCETANTQAWCPGCRGVVSFTTTGDLIPDRTRNNLTLEQVVQCPSQCGQNIHLSNLKKHLKEVCPAFEVPCPMANVGCTFKTRRSEMTEHLRNDNHSQFAMGFFLRVSQQFNAENKRLKSVTEDLSTKIDSLTTMVTDIKNVLESTRSGTRAVCQGIRDLKDRIGEVVDDDEYGLKVVAQQTRKRASPGNGDSSRTVRKNSQIQRQQERIHALEKQAQTTQTAAKAAAAAAAKQAAPE